MNAPSRTSISSGNLPLEPALAVSAGATLRKTLPRLSEATAALLKNFCVRPRQVTVNIGEQTSHWQFSWFGRLSEAAVELEGQSSRLGLKICHDGWCDGIGETSWGDFQGESRTLAWNLAHESLLKHLGALFGQNWRAVGLEAASTPQEGDHITLVWTVTVENHRASGTLTASSDVLNTLLAHNSWSPATEPMPGLDQLRACAAIQMRARSLTVAELEEFNAGDIMVIGTATKCWERLYIYERNSAARWSATRCHNSLRITAPPSLSERFKEVEYEDDMTQDVEAQNIEATPWSVKELPIKISIQLGELQLSLKELEALQRGYIFELPQSLDRVTAQILANGRPIGRGELVTIGDSLGVRLTEFNGHGIQQS